MTSLNEVAFTILKDLLQRRIARIKDENNILPIKNIPTTKEKLDSNNIKTVNIKDVYTSKTESKPNEIVNGYFRLKEARGFGRIDQILFISPSNDYSIYLLIDNRVYFSGTKPFSYFQSYTDYLDGVSCGVDSGEYYLNIKNIFFQDNFLISINANSSITFNEMLIKYTIRNESNV